MTCQLHLHEDPSLIPRSSIKSYMFHAPISPALGRQTCNSKCGRETRAARDGDRSRLRETLCLDEEGMGKEEERKELEEMLGPL